MELGRGALALRRWDQARAAAARAAEVALDRNEAGVASEAREVLEAVSRSRAVSARPRPARPSLDVTRRADELGARLVQALRIFVAQAAAG